MDGLSSDIGKSTDRLVNPRGIIFLHHIFVIADHEVFFIFFHVNRLVIIVGKAERMSNTNIIIAS